MKKLFSLVMFSSIAIQCGSYVTIGSVDWNEQDLKDALIEFAVLYEQRPLKDNHGGMLAPQMFFTWFIVKRLQPKFIIESGVYKGQSTWLLEQAAPQAQIISLDPNPQLRVYISPKVIYKVRDFSRIDWSFLDPKETVCFFDDHYGLDRIKECYARGFKHILYEDNYPIPGGNQYHPSGNGLSPKAAFKEKNQDAAFLYRVIKTYYEFPPITPHRKMLYVPYYDCNSTKLTQKCFSWLLYKDVTPEPLYESAEQDYLKIFEEQAHNYNWYAYIELK